MRISIRAEGVQFGGSKTLLVCNERISETAQESLEWAFELLMRHCPQALPTVSGKVITQPFRIQLRG